MSDLFKRATTKSDPWIEARVAAGWMEPHFPLVADCLLGTPPKKDDAGRMPGSIRVFTNGSDFKACPSGREWIFDGYVVLPKEVDILTALELKLQAGEIGWSVAREQKYSKTDASF